MTAQEMRRNARVLKDLSEMEKSPPKNLSLVRKSANCMRELEAVLLGTENSCYEGGVFRISITIGDNYPFEPPVCKFITPIFHPNVDEVTGAICLNILKKDWKVSISLTTLLLSIQNLVDYPNPDDPLAPERAELFRTNPKVFAERARIHTRTHAIPQASEGKENDKVGGRKRDREGEDDQLESSSGGLPLKQTKFE